jgi:hypothetical protein
MQYVMMNMLNYRENMMIEILREMNIYEFELLK